MNEVIVDLSSEYDCINIYNDNVISDSLHRYLRDYNIDLKKDIVVKIKLNDIVLKQEKKFIKKIIEDDFHNNIKNIKTEFKYLNAKDAMLFFIGFIFVVIYSMLCKFNVAIIAEFFLVLGWVCLWEVAESFIFTRREMRLFMKKYKKYIKSEIEFM